MNEEKVLYEITGKIADINTLLINRLVLIGIKNTMEEVTKERDALARCKLADQDAYVAMRDQRDAALADAKRYRAIPTLDWYVGPMFETYNDVVVGGEYVDHGLSKESLDAAIDKATKGEQP